MSWDKDLAKEFKKRNNPGRPFWFTGIVQNNENLTVSAFDGRVILQSDRLQTVVRKKKIPIPDSDFFTYETEPFVCELGDRVALVGDPFSGAAGSQKILVVGVI